MAIYGYLKSNAFKNTFDFVTSNLQTSLPAGFHSTG